MTMINARAVVPYDVFAKSARLVFPAAPAWEVRMLYEIVIAESSIAQVRADILRLKQEAIEMESLS